jgi:hypothetical protein
VISFLAFHPHLTSAQASNLFSAAETMREDFQGGYYPGVITTDTTNMAVLIGNNRTMSGDAIGVASTYQWTKNGVNISGATQSSYTVSSAALSDFGTYRLVIGLIGGGSASTTPAQLATVTTTTVSNWVNQCNIAQPGVTVSSNTIWAVDTMWNGFVTDSIDTKMLIVNCYVPDSLTACLTPLLNTGGPATWINHSFVDSDLTVNGINNGGSKWVDTGLTDSAIFSSASSVGCTIYVYAQTSSTGLEGLITGDDNGGLMFSADRSGNTQFYDYGPATGGVGNLHVGFPGAGTGLGYYCGTRTGASAEALYFANSGSAHAALATGSSSTTYALVGVDLADFNLVSLALVVNETHSYTSFTKGMTITDSSNQYNRVQSMRTALGGGFR